MSGRPCDREPRPPSPWVTSACVGASLGAAAGCAAMAWALSLDARWPWVALFVVLAAVLVGGACLLARGEHADRWHRAAARRLGAGLVVLAAVVVIGVGP